MQGAKGHVDVDVILDVDQAAAWAAVTDWAGQSQWMLGTQVRATVADGVGVGGVVEAFTGIGPLGVWDTMVITEWDPPHRAAVVHTGRVIRGTGTFEVFALPAGRSRFVWAEDLELPAGRAGQLGWPVVRPLVAAGVRASLARLARQLADR